MRTNIHDVYSAYLKNGTDEATKSGWLSAANQRANFEQIYQLLALNRHLDLSQSSLLDYGCGFATFFDFLNEHNVCPAKYVGVDRDPRFLRRALETHPGVFKFNAVSRINQSALDVASQSVLDVSELRRLAETRLFDPKNQKEVEAKHGLVLGDFMSPDIASADIVVAIGSLAYHDARDVEDILHHFWHQTHCALAFISWWHLPGERTHTRGAPQPGFDPELMRKCVTRFVREARPYFTTSVEGPTEPGEPALERIFILEK